MYFHPLYRGTWFPTCHSSTHWMRPWVKFPSAISRYLVSNSLSCEGNPRPGACFHPLYRGTWFPTYHYRWTSFCGRKSFHPLYRGTWFPTRYNNSYFSGYGAIVSIRYIAVLGFQLPSKRLTVVRLASFHPLYRGTWFPTHCANMRGAMCGPVSIRYIAVLGFQPYQKNTPSDQRRRKRFTHPPSNRSHSHICFLKSR